MKTWALMALDWNRRETVKKISELLRLSVFIGLAMIPLCISSGIAAEDERVSENNYFQLDTITVMATKTPKAPLDSPASVSVITEDEINAFHSAHPFKPLALTEGIWPRQYRGLADYWARPVIRGQRALILVDGVNWHDYGYYSDTAAIPMPDVQRIDVVRGPFSALYGSLAQTGVINYTTKIPDALDANASASYGDWNTRYFSFRIGDKPFGPSEDGTPPSRLGSVLGEDFFYSVSFKSRTTDGYVTTPAYRSLSSPVDGDLDPDTPVVTGWEKDTDPQTGSQRYKIGDQGNNWYEDYGLFVKTGFDFSQHSQVWYSLNVSEFEYGWESGKSYLKDASGTTVYDGDVYVQDGGNTYALSLSDALFTSDPKKKESFIHTLNFSHSVPDTVDITGLVAFNDKESATHYVSRSRYKVEDNSMAQADLAATFHALNDQCLITIGVQGVQEKATVTENNLSDPYDEDTITSVYQETSGENLTLGSFLQVEYTPIEMLTMYAGGRYDHWWGNDADYTNIDGTSMTYPDMDDGQFSPKVSLVYRPMQNGVVRASYGEAFTAPSLYYRTASYYWEGGGTISMADPNPDLGPTTNESWEIGTEWELWEKRLRVKATYFENDFEDLVVNQSQTYTLDDGTQVTEKKRVNAEAAEVNGIEASIQALLPYDMKAGAFYAHNWSEYTQTDDPSKTGWEMAEAPTDMWSIWWGYFGRLIELSLSYRYCDSRYDDAYASYADTVYKGDDEYHVVDAQLTLKPRENIAVSLSVDNLFDEEYYEYYRAPGRFFLGTVSLDF
jgi:iron complex outermembrane receptor protein